MIDTHIHLLHSEPPGNRVAACGLVEHSSVGERSNFTIDPRYATCLACSDSVIHTDLRLTILNSLYYCPDGARHVPAARRWWQRKHRCQRCGEIVTR